MYPDFGKRIFIIRIGAGSPAGGLGMWRSPVWAFETAGRSYGLSCRAFDLPVARTQIGISKHPRAASTANGTLLSANLDGAPGAGFACIASGDSYAYRFNVRQHGNCRYRLHSSLQERAGVYGPHVVDPATPGPIPSDRAYVVMLADWSDEDPRRIEHWPSPAWSIERRSSAGRRSDGTRRPAADCCPPSRGVRRDAPAGFNKPVPARSGSGSTETRRKPCKRGRAGRAEFAPKPI
ncbi:multicopper oxidase domain-containing protein [Burkholderia territorii]|uniref:multicopper oxidase domain-containing protein n=1 Tax=Burkholderia territorii TaxID=1503055 RepID=UPI0009BECA68|nr:multicopper oxidase domain-containing protein [Burkholderia territorii]